MRVLLSRRRHDRRRGDDPPPPPRLVTGAYALHTVAVDADGTRRPLAILVMHVHDSAGECSEVPLAFDASGLRLLMDGLMSSHEALAYLEDHPEATDADAEKVARFVADRMEMIRAASAIAFGEADITEGLT